MHTFKFAYLKSHLRMVYGFEVCRVKVDKEIKGSSMISASFTSTCIIICKYVSHMRFYESLKFKTRMCELCTFSHILSR